MLVRTKRGLIIIFFLLQKTKHAYLLLKLLIILLDLLFASVYPYVQCRFHVTSQLSHCSTIALCHVICNQSRNMLSS